MAKKVLLIEDDPGTQKLMGRMLHKIDPHVVLRSVWTAEEAYRILKEYAADGDTCPYDIVLVDLQLPGSNGLVLWELCRKSFPEIDFVFVSGVSGEDWYRRIGSCPVWPQLLQKPLSEERLRIFWEQRFSPPGQFGG